MSEIPTIDVYRDGKHARINEADLPAWRGEGWTPEDAVEKEAEVSASLEDEAAELQAALDEQDEIAQPKRRKKR